MDYLELVDWTARVLRQTKRGVIPETAPDIFNRLAIDPTTWLKHMRPRQSKMLVAIGAKPVTTGLKTGRLRCLRVRWARRHSEIPSKYSQKS